MIDPFEAQAQRQMSAPVKRKHKREFKSLSEAPMVLTGLTKKRSENSKLYRLYRRAKRADYRKHLGGPLRTEWLALSRLLRKLSFDNPQEIVDYVAQAEWLHNADRDTKYMALSIIGHTISRLRVRNGYAPFDDSCYGEEPTAFEIIREQLR